MKSWGIVKKWESAYRFEHSRYIWEKPSLAELEKNYGEKYETDSKR